MIVCLCSHMQSCVHAYVGGNVCATAFEWRPEDTFEVGFSPAPLRALEDSVSG